MPRNAGCFWYIMQSGINKRNQKTKPVEPASQAKESAVQYHQRMAIDDQADQGWVAESSEYRQWVLERAELSYREYRQRPESAMALGEFRQWLSEKEYLNSK